MKTTRRDILKGAIAAALVPSFGAADAAVISVAAPFGLATSLSMSAKRADGGSGTAVFNGPAPFQPGQMSVAGLSGMSIWNGGTELPIAVVDSGLRHSDGSVKVAFVHTQLSAANQVEVPLTLQLATAPSAGSVTPTTVSESTMFSPKALACTDADHLCKSRVALGPLVPIATLRSLGLNKFADFLEPELIETGVNIPTLGKPKAFMDAGSTGQWWSGGSGNAQYNAQYVAYCLYLVTGKIEYLINAWRFSSWTEGSQYTVAQNSHENAHVVLKGTSTEWGCNPEYAEPLPGAGGQPFTLSEPASGCARDLFMTWALSGWEQARGAGVAYGLRNIFNASNEYPNGSPWFCRFDFRHHREHAAILPMYNLTEALTYRNSGGGSWTVDGEPYTDTTFWGNFFQTYYYDRFNTWAQQMTGGDPRFGIWGHITQSYSDGTPLFQHVTVFNLLYELELNVYQDDQNRTWQQIFNNAEWLLDNKIGGPWDVSGNSGFGPVDEVYNASFLTSDGTPPNLGAGNTLYTPAMLMPMMSFAYAYARDTGMSQATIDKFKRFVDAECSNHCFQFADGINSAGDHWKQVGEEYEMAFTAAALRAGVRYDGWNLA